MPFRIAFLERYEQVVTARTEAIVTKDPRGRAWVLGGHSRGGKMAARFAQRHAERLAGLLLVGTSHPHEENMAALSLDVTKVYGSEDGLASEAEVKQFAPLLPAHTHWVRVEGGNHAQFGWYGGQLGDSRARISREDQQQVLLEAALAQLRRVSALNVGTLERSTR